MQITQIYISDNNVPPVGPIRSYMNSIKDAAAGHEYKCYSDSMIELFLRDGFGVDVLAAYRQLRPYSFKADMARYCILYRFGGWYIDAGMQWCLPSFDVNSKVDLIAFRDMQEYWGNSWACAPGIIYAKPKHPALKLVIERVMSNIRNRYYGLTPLCPTEPIPWGAALAQAGLSKGLVMGDFKHTTPSYQHKNTCCLLPSGQIVARWKPLLPSGGRLSDTANKGLNNYMSLWKDKNVYCDEDDD